MAARGTRPPPRPCPRGKSRDPDVSGSPQGGGRNVLAVGGAKPDAYLGVLVTPALGRAGTSVTLRPVGGGHPSRQGRTEMGSPSAQVPQGAPHRSRGGTADRPARQRAPPHWGRFR